MPMLCWPWFALLGPLSSSDGLGCGHFNQEYIDALKCLGAVFSPRFSVVLFAVMCCALPFCSMAYYSEETAKAQLAKIVPLWRTRSMERASR